MDRPYRNIFIVCAVITVGAGVLRSPDVDEDLRELLGALVLLPLGFFLGGVFIYGGDPGIGVILVPPGALLLFISVLLIARASRDSAK